MLEIRARGTGRQGIGRASAVADPEGSGRSPLDWAASARPTLWVGRLWEGADPDRDAGRVLGPTRPGAGLWLPAAVLHLHDPHALPPGTRPAPATPASTTAFDAEPPGLADYALYNEGVAWLRQHHTLHPLELPGVLESRRRR